MPANKDEKRGTWIAQLLYGLDGSQKEKEKTRIRNEAGSTGMGAGFPPNANG